MNAIAFTKEGVAELEKEAETLKEQRKLVIVDLQKARELGDLRENGLYKASKQRLGFIDGRLRHIAHLLKNATVIERTSSDTVSIGCRVTLHDGERTSTYHIVGDFEADPLEGKISQKSPIGRQLIGKKKGDTIEVIAPTKTFAYTITDIA